MTDETSSTELRSSESGATSPARGIGIGLTLAAGVVLMVNGVLTMAGGGSTFVTIGALFVVVVGMGLRRSATPKSEP